MGALLIPLVAPGWEHGQSFFRSTGTLSAPGDDPANTRAARPVVAAYASATFRTRSSEPVRASTATVPPLPPPVIFAPNRPLGAPARRTAATNWSAPSEPSPHAE